MNKCKYIWPLSGKICDAPRESHEGLYSLVHDFMSSSDRALEKQKSRDEDARRLAAGKITPEELRKENSFFNFDGGVKVVYFGGKPRKWHHQIDWAEAMSAAIMFGVFTYIVIKWYLG